MNNEFYAYGEMLWDCLPAGRHAGGAPFNVACHLAQLGMAARLISAVGQDPRGDELLQVAQGKKVDTRFVSRVRSGLPTGTVNARVDGSGNATYEIVQPVAWDEIQVPAGALAAVETGRAFVFGSLAARSAHNAEQLGRLLALRGPVKFFDVNLRPPFVDLPRIVELARRADVLKLNDDEAGQLATYLRTGTAGTNAPARVEEVAAACVAVSEASAVTCICVTRGAGGAILWERGKVIHAPAPPAVVKDTVGAGDAFMAGLMVGLTHGVDRRTALNTACELGAYVASRHGATPPLPPDKIQDWVGALAGPSDPA